MAKKQVTTTNTAAAAAPARAATSGTSRVSTVKHSKSVVQETPAAPAPAASPVDSHAAISKIAYGYWVARGYQDGRQHEDWVRAEKEFRNKQ